MPRSNKSHMMRFFEKIQKVPAKDLGRQEYWFWTKEGTQRRKAARGVNRSAGSGGSASHEYKYDNVSSHFYADGVQWNPARWMFYQWTGGYGHTNPNIQDGGFLQWTSNMGKIQQKRKLFLRDKETMAWGLQHHPTYFIEFGDQPGLQLIRPNELFKIVSPWHLTMMQQTRQEEPRTKLLKKEPARPILHMPELTGTARHAMVMWYASGMTDYYVKEKMGL